MTSVTAVIPCYNGEKYLAKAIASVRAQTRPVDGVLVVDDQSIDRSRAVAEAAGARVVTLERNSGPSEARNAGLRLAEGEFVAFLDADDEWTPEHCALVVGLLERSPESVLGFGRSAYQEIPSVVSPATMPEGVPFDALEGMLRENLVTQSAAIVRRRIALDVGGYDPSMRHSEDYDLWLRLAVRGPFVATHTVTCWRALHDAQASLDVRSMRRGAWRARSLALARISDDARRRAARQAIVDGWRQELDDAWYAESPVDLDTALVLRHHHSLPAGPFWVGTIRRRVLWHPRQLVRYVWRRMRARLVSSPLLATTARPKQAPPRHRSE